MAKLIVKSGSTSRLEHVFILDSTSTTGAGKTGLTNASVTLYYWRPGDTSIGAQTGTMSAGTLGTWSSFGFKEMDATNLPGFYEVGLPNAVFAAGTNHAVVMIKGTGIAPVTLEYQLVAFDPDSGSNLGLSALPTASTGTAGAIITSGTGTAQLSVSSGAVTTGAVTSGVIAADVWNALLATYTVNNSFGQRVVRSTTSQSTVAITGSNHIAADVHQLQPDVITAAGVAADTDEAIADALLNRNIAGGSNAGRLVKEALYALRNKSVIVGSTLNVYNATDAAIAWFATVSSSAAADPVTGIDPA